MAGIPVPGEYCGLPRKGSASLQVGDRHWELPLVEGNDGRQAIDITNLHAHTGLRTLDAGYQNTSSCVSSVSLIDHERGRLLYRGIPIEALAERASFAETAYLLIYGQLPEIGQLRSFRTRLTEHSMLHKDMLSFFVGLPNNGSPMAVLSAMVNALSIYYPAVGVPDEDDTEETEIAVTRLISKVRTIAAFSYKKSIGEPFVYPRARTTYVANFLHMLFSSPIADYRLDHRVIRALNRLLLLHADHGQSCCTSTVRLVGSSRVNLYASVCAGICALWGPLHGAANQRVVESLLRHLGAGMDAAGYIARIRENGQVVRVPGFGSRLYPQAPDPRALIARSTFHDLYAQLAPRDPIFSLALEIERLALSDPWFLEHHLYPNLDFYSGLAYLAIGIPLQMFPVLFAIGRLPGWIAQWLEMKRSNPFWLGRPDQVYDGPPESPYLPIAQRGGPAASQKKS